MSPRRRRGGDEFADERPWLAEDDEDTGPWPPEDDAASWPPPEDDAGPWPPAEAGDGWNDSPGRAAAGGRRGRHSAPADQPAGPDSGWNPSAHPPRQAGRYESPAAGTPSGWDESGGQEPSRGDQDREDRYALRPEPEPSPPRRAAPWEQDPPPRGRYPAGQEPGPPAPGREARRVARRAAAPGNARPPAGYPDAGGRYAGPGGQYGDPGGRERGAAGRNGGPGGRDADRGDHYRDPGAPYDDPGDRRAGSRGRYAGDDYQARGRGGGVRRPDASARRAGPGSDGYRDDYGGPGHGQAAGPREPFPGDQPARGGRDPRGGRSGPAGTGYGGQSRGRPGYGPGQDAAYRDAHSRVPDQEDPDWDDGGYQDEGWPFGEDTGKGDSGRRPKRKRRGRWAGPGSLLVVAAIILIPLIIGGVYAYRVISAHYNPPNYSGSGTGQVIFQVKPGDTSLTVGDRLVTEGVVASSRALVLAAEHSSNSNMLQPGFYRLHKHMNAQLAWNLLLSPSARVQLKVTIPEGYRVPQVLAALSKQSGIPASDFNKVIKDTSALGLPSYAKGNPEGYLFPATYDIQPHMTATDVLKAMVTAFNQEAASINLPQAAAKGHITPAEAIVVASLAQAEGGKVSDFPKITRVIYNRLNAHMPLELDSTVLYALHTYGILASNQQLKVKSPYNTYAHQGLPPAPIDSPGNAAIQAALHPAKGNWLYFVTVNPKTKQTDFTNSPTVFQQYKNQLQQYLSSHGG